jgi:hypothetical protein
MQILEIVYITVSGGIFRVNHLKAEDLAAVGQHVSASPGGISISALAQRLSVSLPTARRRLRAYAAAHGLTLQSRPAREGTRGPASARWYLSSPAAPAGPPPPPLHVAPKVPFQRVDEAQDAPLGLAPAVLNALEDDELLALRLLAKGGSARTGELAARVGRSPDRMEGMMRMLRRKLHRLGSPRIDNETLPDGEALFHFVRNGPS